MSNARRFHEAIVESCGSETMIVAVGALEAIWSAHAPPMWDDDVVAVADRARLRTAVAAHERIFEAIAAGDAVLAAALVREHGAVTTSVSPESMDMEVVDASLVSHELRTPRVRLVRTCL